MADLWPELQQACPGPSGTAPGAVPLPPGLSQPGLWGEGGAPFVPPVVLQEEGRLAAAPLDKEYLPIDGDPAARAAAAQWLFGEAAALAEARVAACQCLGMAGGVRLAADFYKAWAPLKTSTPVYVPAPAPAALPMCFRAAGFTDLRTYPLRCTGAGVDTPALHEALAAAPSGAIVVLCPACHDPPGLGLSPEQWGALGALMTAKAFIPLVLLSGQCQFSSDPMAERRAVRQWENNGVQFAVALSFSRTMGLSGERVGWLFFVTTASAEALAVTAQLKAIVRPMYSNPPCHGARIVHAVLSQPEKLRQWENALATEACRLAQC